MHDIHIIMRGAVSLGTYVGPWALYVEDDRVVSFRYAPKYMFIFAMRCRVDNVRIFVVVSTGF